MENDHNHPVQFGKYQILKELGRGGFGIVYHAFDTVLEVERAIKELYPNLVIDPSFVSRFRQEARAATRSRSPGVFPASRPHMLSISSSNGFTVCQFPGTVAFQQSNWFRGCTLPGR